MDETREVIDELEWWLKALESRGLRLWNKKEYIECESSIEIWDFGRQSIKYVVTLDGKVLPISECFKYLESILWKNEDINKMSFIGYSEDDLSGGW